MPPMVRCRGGVFQMGLFGALFSSKKKPVASQRSKSSRSHSKASSAAKTIQQLRAETEAEDKRFNQIMEKVGNALDACAESDWSAESLEDYRRVIELARINGVNLSTAHDFRLTSGYIKRKMYDAAWGYLNAMLMSHPTDLWKIRKEMCRICKKEGRWVDALGFLMMSHASKYGGFNADAFLKDLGPIERKLSLTEEEKRYLIEALSSLRGDERKRDAKAAALHRRFYEEQLKPRMS